MRGKEFALPVGDRDEEEKPVRPEPEPPALPLPPPKKGELGQWLKALDEELETTR